MNEQDNLPYRKALFQRYQSTHYAPRSDLSPIGIQKVANRYKYFLGPYLPQKKEASILEVGCGGGGFLPLCEQLGYTKVQAMDIAPENVAFCHERGFTYVQCAEASNFLSQSQDRFDLIVLSDVLEHMTKDEVIHLLHLIHRRLYPTGTVILRVPNLSNPFNIRSRYVDFTHEVGLTKESLQQILRVSGFQIKALFGEFETHRRRLARLIFDRVLWKLFLLFYHHTMHLHAEVIRGKNLIAVGEKPCEEGL